MRSTTGKSRERTERDALLSLWNDLYSEARYKRVVAEIAAQFIKGDRLLKAGGGHDESFWTEVREPVHLGGYRWTVKLFNFVTAVDLEGGPVLITFVRLVPPDSLKADLRRQAKGGSGKSHAMGAYGLALTGPEATQLKVDFASAVNRRFPREQYVFFPTDRTFGLFERLDYDAILPFISAASFTGKLKP